MRVGFSLLTLFPGRVGGTETYVQSLLREFAGGHGGVEVVVLANRQVARSPAYRGLDLPLVEVPSYRAGDSALTRLAAMVHARTRPRAVARDVPAGLDVIHHPVTVPIPSVASLPRVCTLHDLQHHELPQFFSRGELAFRRWAYDGAARSADLVVAISEHCRRSIVERLGVAEDRVIAIPHAVDHGRFRPDPPPQETPLVLPERYLLYPANLWPHKNHERLLRAFARVGDPDLHLVLTGQTYGRPLPGPSDPRVRHLGHVALDDLPQLYRRATALVFPSLFEGFGFPPLEAMACGCPVAASGEGALAEICADAALPLDPRDEESMTAAMTRIATDSQLRARLREAGLDRAAAFTWARSAERHADAYRRARSARIAR